MMSPNAVAKYLQATSVEMLPFCMGLSIRSADYFSNPRKHLIVVSTDIRAALVFATILADLDQILDFCLSYVRFTYLSEC